jgi:hypothetical protein
MLSQFNNLPLRYGEVKEVIYPTDQRSQSKKFLEYRVRVVQRNGSSASSPTDYRNCYVASLFGGVADKFQYTLRPATHLYPDNGRTDLRDGSRVLLLCINGETNNAFIVAAIPNEQGEGDSQEDGHNLQFEFNGLNANINKDGEFVVTHKGATDIKGNLVDAGAPTGGYFKFKKDGTFLIYPKEGVRIGEATDFFILGSTYRDAESQMHQSVTDALDQAASILNQAGASLIVAAGAAVYSTAAPQIGSAGTRIVVASTFLRAARAAILSFEQGADSYLSTRNKSD